MRGIRELGDERHRLSVALSARPAGARIAGAGRTATGLSVSELRPS
ncbi:hypothetical protein [Streptomyces sp. NPDC050485]